VGGEDEDGFWADGVCDFVAEFAELDRGWMVVVFHDIGPAVAEEVNWCARHRCTDVGEPETDLIVCSMCSGFSAA